MLGSMYKKIVEEAGRRLLKLYNEKKRESVLSYFLPT